ncbi:MAG: hypothetical protein OXF62_07660 [Caldilineaceae bacterium]|nr:hypothetical protein [Caldilineaceae bacterium]
MNAVAESLWQEVEQRLRVFEGREGRHRACPYQTGEGEDLEIMRGGLGVRRFDPSGLAVQFEAQLRYIILLPSSAYSAIRRL